MTYVTKAAIAWFFFYNFLTRFKQIHLSFDKSYCEREIFLNCDVTLTPFFFYFRYEINNTINHGDQLGLYNEVIYHKLQGVAAKFQFLLQSSYQTVPGCVYYAFLSVMYQYKRKLVKIYIVYKKNTQICNHGMLTKHSASFISMHR